jgi:hypothetical protein
MRITANMKNSQRRLTFPDLFIPVFKLPVLFIPVIFLYIFATFFIGITLHHHHHSR